jgi:hypothetical protein
MTYPLTGLVSSSARLLMKLSATGVNTVVTEILPTMKAASVRDTVLLGPYPMRILANINKLHGQLAKIPFLRYFGIGKIRGVTANVPRKTETPSLYIFANSQNIFQFSQSLTKAESGSSCQLPQKWCSFQRQQWVPGPCTVLGLPFEFRRM